MGFLNGLLKGLGFEVEKKEKPHIKEEKESKAYKNAGLEIDLSTIKSQPQIFAPNTEQDVQNLVDILKTGEAITIDLKNFSDSEYIRSLDFLSGAIYTLNGKIKKVSEKTFFFCPNIKRWYINSMKFFEKPKIYKFRYGILTASVSFVVLFWDQILKLITDGFETTVINGFFWISSTHNTGAAYGIFSGQTIMLITVSTIMILILLVYNYFKSSKSIFYCISLGLILGGAIGNLLDRIFLGYVRDFIKFSFFNFNFNIADACLTIGVVLFIAYLIFFDNVFKSKKTKGE